MRYTPDIITELGNGEIFVYGSNQFAQHGAGSAKAAFEKFGAIMNDAPIGLVGKSYGIITASCTNTPVAISFISDQVNVLYHFARLRPDLAFLVTKIGTGIAGFSIREIAGIFFALEDNRPNNIVLPKEFSKNV